MPVLKGESLANNCVFFILINIYSIPIKHNAIWILNIFAGNKKKKGIFQTDPEFTFSCVQCFFNFQRKKKFNKTLPFLDCSRS